LKPVHCKRKLKRLNEESILDAKSDISPKRQRQMKVKYRECHDDRSSGDNLEASYANKCNHIIPKFVDKNSIFNMRSQVIGNISDGRWDNSSNYPVLVGQSNSMKLSKIRYNENVESCTPSKIVKCRKGRARYRERVPCQENSKVEVLQTSHSPEKCVYTPVLKKQRIDLVGHTGLINLKDQLTRGGQTATTLVTKSNEDTEHSLKELKLKRDTFPYKLPA